MSRIEWRHNGRQLLLPILILPPTPSASLDGVAATALLDTGSTTSEISRAIADELGLVRRGKRPLGSAGGEVQAERYLFRIGLMTDALAAPSFPFTFDDVIGFELKDSDRFNALLGMDVLAQCDLRLDRRGNCTLAFGYA